MVIKVCDFVGKNGLHYGHLNVRSLWNKFDLIRLDRSWIENSVIKRGGGVCCYVQSDLSVSNTEFCQFNMSNKNIEILWLTINIPNCEKLIIGNIYCPP